MADDGFEPSAGPSGGGSNWRKATYKDKLFELQSIISNSAGGDSPGGMYYGVETLVAILRPVWDIPDEDLEMIDDKSVAETIRNFRAMREEIEKDWDDVGKKFQRPPANRIFKMIGECWKLIDEAVSPIFRKTPVSKSKWIKKKKGSVTPDEARAAGSEAEDGIQP